MSRRACQLALAATAALLGLALPPAPVEACVRSRVPGGGPCLFWGERVIPFRVNQEGTDDITDGQDIDATVRGYERWNAAGCSDFQFAYAGLTSRRDVGFDPSASDNTNLVVWRERPCREVVPAEDACWSCLQTGEACCSTRYHCWEHPGGVIAVTTTTFNRTTGLLVDADLELNGADFWYTVVDGPQCSDPDPPQTCAADGDCRAGERCFAGLCLERACVRTDIENTVTHEAGHVAGLDHTDDIDATMFASAPEGETAKRTLESDDLQCFCDTYPTDGPTLTCFADNLQIVPIRYLGNTRGCLGCSSAGEGVGGLAVALLWLVWRGRRRRGVDRQPGNERRTKRWPGTRAPS